MTDSVEIKCLPQRDNRSTDIATFMYCTFNKSNSLKIELASVPWTRNNHKFTSFLSRPNYHFWHRWGSDIFREGSLSSSSLLPLRVLQKAGRSPTALSQLYDSTNCSLGTGQVWEFLWGLRHSCGDYQYIPSSQAQRHETELLCPLVYCRAQGTNSCLLA